MSCHAADISRKICVVFLNVLLVTLLQLSKRGRSFPPTSVILLQYKIVRLYLQSRPYHHFCYTLKQKACVCYIITYTAMVVTGFSSILISSKILFFMSSKDNVYGSLIILILFTKQ